MDSSWPGFCIMFCIISWITPELKALPRCAPVAGVVAVVVLAFVVDAEGVAPPIN